MGGKVFVSTFGRKIYFSCQHVLNLKRQSFSFSVQNVEAEDGNDNWDDGWYGGRVSSSVVGNEKDLRTDVHDAKRREPRCSFSVLMCESRGMVGVPAKPNNPRRDKAQAQTWEDTLIKENEEWRKHSLPDQLTRITAHSLVSSWNNFAWISFLQLE